VLSGFPWLALGYSQLDSSVRGYAPVIGVYGVSLVVAMTAGAIVAVLLGTLRSRIGALLIIASIWIGGAVLWRHDWTTPLAAPVSVALVQGAVPQTLKWQDGTLERTEALYLALTRPHFGADIVVWPEVSIPAVEADVREFIAGVRLEAVDAGLRARDGSAARRSRQRTTTTTPSTRGRRVSRPASSGTSSAGWCRSASTFPCRPSCATGCGS
jgi:apolipoprotein N-acyltransferase